MNAPLVQHDPERLVGTFRRFGAFGPVYRIERFVRSGRSKRREEDLLMEVALPESGERLEYSYWDILEDPVAR